VSEPEAKPDSADAPEPIEASPAPDEAAPQGKKKKAKGEFGSGRAVETLFKVLYRNHIELTAIADTKANIMVGINGLLTSVSLGVVLPRLDAGWAPLLLPAAILVVGCAVSLVCAILSARPRVANVSAALDDVRAGRANLLFFGTFSSLTPAEFNEGLRGLMDQPVSLFEQMGRDIHALGSVLTRKYLLLRASYTALLVTVIASVASALAVGVLR
jgi:Family of unknown function (DUF5706)